MGAVVTTPEIANNLNKALHFNTFGGNPMASAVGLSVLNVGFKINSFKYDIINSFYQIIEEEKLQQNSLEVGTYFMFELAKLRDRYEIIGDVRGKVSSAI